MTTARAPGPATGRAGLTPARRALLVALRLVVVAGLGVDAAVHWSLAGAMDLAAPGGIGGGTLFRAQALLAAVTAVLVLVLGRWTTYLLAVLVAGSALVAVLAYTALPIPAIGPVPSMADPFWYPAKVASAVAEALAVVAALAALLLGPRRRRGPRGATAGR